MQKLASNSNKRKETQQKVRKFKPVKSKVPTIKSSATGGQLWGGGGAITDFFKIIIPNHHETKCENQVRISGEETYK